MPLINNIETHIKLLQKKGLKINILEPIIDVDRQMGPNCGLYAIAAIVKYFSSSGLNVFLNGDEKINISARKRDVVNNSVNQEDHTSLRHILRKDLQVGGIGGVLDIYNLKSLSEHIGFSARVLYSPSSENFIQMVCQAIDLQLPMVVALNVEDDGKGYLSPSTESLGNDPHYATVIGYYKNHNNVMFIMAEDSIYYETDALELQAANECAIYFSQKTYTKEKSSDNHKHVWQFFGYDVNAVDKKNYKVAQYPSTPLDTCFAARSLLIFPKNYNDILNDKCYLQESTLMRGESSLVAKQQAQIDKLEDDCNNSVGAMKSNQQLIDAIEKARLLRARVEFIHALNDDIGTLRNVMVDYDLSDFYDKALLISLAVTAIHNFRHDIVFEMILEGLSIESVCDDELFLTECSVLSFCLQRMCSQDLSFLLKLIEHNLLTVECIADQDENETFIMYLLTMFDAKSSSELIKKLIEVNPEVIEYEIWGRKLNDYLSSMNIIDDDTDLQISL